MAENTAVKRIRREMRKFEEDEKVLKNGISVQSDDDNILKLKGKIEGPTGTPYEAGTFVLDISLPDKYPFYPPEVRFITKIWHPNISFATGSICHNIFEDDWVTSGGIRTILIYVQAMLSSAEPDDPEDAVVAIQCKETPDLFERTAKFWAHKYAGAPGSDPDFEEKVGNLVRMGIDEKDAIIALSSHFWDEAKAVDSIYR